MCNVLDSVYNRDIILSKTHPRRAHRLPRPATLRRSKYSLRPAWWRAVYGISEERVNPMRGLARQPRKLHQRKTHHSPHGAPMPFRLLDTDIKPQVAGRRVPVDRAPVPATHNILTLGIASVRVLREKRDLGRKASAQGLSTDQIHYLTMVSSVSKWCRVR